MKSTPRTLRIGSIGTEQRSAKGYPFIECRTDAGIVAFWGSANRRVNLNTLRGLTAPITVEAGCRPPGQGYPLHHLWVPETADLRVLAGTVPVSVHAEGDTPTLDELRLWRRALTEYLRRIDDVDHSTLAGQIRALTLAGRVPRDIAAMMRVVTETRNAVEHEGAAARSAWAGVCEWIDAERVRSRP